MCRRITRNVVITYTTMRFKILGQQDILKQVLLNEKKNSLDLIIEINELTM